MKRILKAAAVYFAAVFGAGFVLGTLRVLLLEPEVGSRAAELIEMPFMLAVMIFASRWVVRRFALPPAVGVRLGVGGIAVALVLLIEFTFVLRMRGLSLREYFAYLDPVAGSAYYALLAVYAALPLLMQNKRWYTVHATGWGSAALAVMVFGFAYAGYVADLERSVARISQGSSIAATECGPIEYAQAGEGPALLVVHGAGGGFDQGMEFAELARRGFRVIAPSRFGYLRTPMPADASPEAQADAHACLLDHLGIERAAIAGVSAGAPSSMQFALRHPARTSALVLLVPLAYAPREAEPLSRGNRFMLERAVQSDALYWLALRLAPGLVMKTILATPPELLAEASDAERERVEALMEHLLPLSRRRNGLMNDARIAASLGPYPLERIGARTLVISLQDDLYGTFESAGHTAAHIRGSHFIGYRRGGHVWVGHHRVIVGDIVTFLSGATGALAAP